MFENNKPKSFHETLDRIAPGGWFWPLWVVVAFFVHLFEKSGERFYFAYEHSIGFRFFIQFISAVTVLLGVIGFWIDMGDRKIQRAEWKAEQEIREKDRAVRKASLLAQLGELASKGKEQQAAVGPAIRSTLEILVAEEVSLKSIQLANVVAPSSNLQRAKLLDSNLQGADLSGVDFQEAEFQGANLQRVDLEGANLRRANFRRKNKPFLEELQLTFRSAANQPSLLNINFLGANLQEANLESSILQEANLEWAELQGANLRWSELQKAWLYMANLQAADISGANFSNAKNLTQEQILSACADLDSPPIGLPKHFKMPLPCPEEE